jgi:hypothetical protein
MDAVTLALIAGAAVVLFQAYVMYRVVANPGLTGGQKVAQCVLIWVLPLLGAVIVYIMLGVELGVRPADCNFTPQTPNDSGPMD